MVRSSVSSAALAVAVLGCASPTGVAPSGDHYEVCDDPELRTALEVARQAIARGDREAALLPLRRVVDGCPEFVPAHMLYQDTAIDVGGEDEAIMRAFYQHREDDSSSPVGPYVASRLATDDATRVALLDVALQRDRSFYYAYFAKGDLWRRLSRTGQALEMLQKAVTARPEHAPSNRSLAEVLVTLGRGAEARGYYENYVRLRPGDRQAKKAYIELLVYGLARPRDASPWIEELLRSDPEDVELLMDRGAAAWLSGDVDGSVATYREVLGHDPERSRAVLNLGNLYFEALPRKYPDRRDDFWRKARLAYRYYLDMDSPEGFFDLWDRYLSVLYRLAEIDAELEPLPDGYVASLSDF